MSALEAPELDFGGVAGFGTVVLAVEQCVDLSDLFGKDTGGQADRECDKQVAMLVSSAKERHPQLFHTHRLPAREYLAWKRRYQHRPSVQMHQFQWAAREGIVEGDGHVEEEVGALAFEVFVFGDLDFDDGVAG